MCIATEVVSVCPEFHQRSYNLGFELTGFRDHSRLLFPSRLWSVHADDCDTTLLLVCLMTLQEKQRGTLTVELMIQPVSFKLIYIVADQGVFPDFGPTFTSIVETGMHTHYPHPSLVLTMRVERIGLVSWRGVRHTNDQNPGCASGPVPRNFFSARKKGVERLVHCWTDGWDSAGTDGVRRLAQLGMVK